MAETRKYNPATSAVGDAIRAALGEDAVFSPVLRSAHRPEAAWDREPFDVERAIRAAALEHRRSGSGEVWGASEESARSRPSLPEVSDGLWVVSPRPTHDAGVELDPGTADVSSVEAMPWPKPERQGRHESPPLLPPRPLVLFPVPEPAEILAASGPSRSIESSVSNDGARSCGEFLRWRGESLELIGLGGHERFESEWWTTCPLIRDYVVAEVVDGRRFWLFFQPSGEVFVHGVFD